MAWEEEEEEGRKGEKKSLTPPRKYILDNMVTALEADPRRRFIYVEMAFFIRWWREQTPAMQARVRRLQASGQLEFINGGWTMNDESGVSDEDIIAQMTRGHFFLKEVRALCGLCVVCSRFPRRLE